MAITVLKRDYVTNAYQSFVDDLTAAFSWNDVESSADGYGTTTFKKYNDATGENYAWVRVAKSATASPAFSVTVGYTNATNTYASSGINGVHANLAIWETGICVLLTTTETEPANADAVACFGVCWGTKVNKTAQKWSVWGLYDNNLFVGGDDIFSASSAERPYTYEAPYYAARPLFTPYCSYVINDLLLLDVVKESAPKLCGYGTFDGKRYYRNGVVLIPADV